jgi:hypothetical protein
MNALAGILGLAALFVLFGLAFRPRRGCGTGCDDTTRSGCGGCGGCAHATQRAEDTAP